MINRNHVRQFLAVVDTGSFTQAAHMINVTQPTLSAGISELERQLGARLFVREKRRIYLTSAGNQFLVNAREIQKLFRQAEQEMVEDNVRELTIHLGVIDTLASSFLERVLRSFKNDMPHSSIILTEGKEGQLLSELSKGKIDVAINILPDFYDSDHHILYEEDYCLMTAAEHHAADKVNIAPQILANDVMIARRSCEILQQTSKFFTSHGVRPPFAMRSVQEDRIMKMVRSGLGITVAPRSHSIDGVKAITLEGFDYKRQIGILYGQSWKRDFGNDHVLIQAIIKEASSMKEELG